MYVSIMLQAFVFNLFNGYLQGMQLVLGSYSTWACLEWSFMCGVIIFLSGWAINYHSDDVLRNLRKPGDTGYHIPYGGAFRWVTAANYFGEILEWSGWALATFSLAGTSFALFTFANIGPRARSHHQWCLNKFGSAYPKNRTAVIPFLW